MVALVYRSLMHRWVALKVGETGIIMLPLGANSMSWTNSVISISNPARRQHGSLGEQDNPVAVGRVGIAPRSGHRLGTTYLGWTR